MDGINYDLEIQKHSPSYIENFNDDLDDIMEDEEDELDLIGDEYGGI